jgi:hypothetical protein
MLKLCDNYDNMTDNIVMATFDVGLKIAGDK